MNNFLPPIGSLLKNAAKQIPMLDATLLMAATLGYPKEYVYAHPEYRPTLRQLVHFKKTIWQRSRGKPLAYLLGRQEFYGRNFLVNKNVLIPRPETEILVETALAAIKNNPTTQQPTVLIDVGTGSGCIPLTILSELPHLPIQAVAIDISRAALAVARQNAKTYGVKITLQPGDLLSPLLAGDIPLPTGAKIFITANLPYLSVEQFKNEPSIQREPRVALVAKAAGLALYQKLLAQIPPLKQANQPASITLLMEINPEQAPPLKNQLTQLFPSATLSSHRDLAGRDRVLEVSKI